MGRILASLVVAAALLSIGLRRLRLGSAAPPVSAPAAGGAAYSIVDAKLWALRSCERRSPVPVCTILWCRPGR